MSQDLTKADIEKLQAIKNAHDNRGHDASDKFADVPPNDALQASRRTAMVRRGPYMSHHKHVPDGDKPLCGETGGAGREWLVKPLDVLWDDVPWCRKCRRLWGDQ